MVERKKTGLVKARKRVSLSLLLSFIDPLCPNSAYDTNEDRIAC